MAWINDPTATVPHVDLLGLGREIFDFDITEFAKKVVAAAQAKGLELSFDTSTLPADYSNAYLANLIKQKGPQAALTEYLSTHIAPLVEFCRALRGAEFDDLNPDDADEEHEDPILSSPGFAIQEVLGEFGAIFHISAVIERMVYQELYEREI